MSDEEVESVAMAECGACRAIIPIDSESCPECGTNFSGISEDALGEDDEDDHRSASCSWCLSGVCCLVVKAL